MAPDMATRIKPGETNAIKKTVYLSLFDPDGRILDDEGAAVTNGAAWAVAFAGSGITVADLTVGYDNSAGGAAAGTFAYLVDGECKYIFADAEVAAGLAGGGVDARSVWVRFKKNNYRSVKVRIDLRYDVENTSTDAIDANALKADAVTEIQAGLATAANLAIVAGYVDTEIGTLQTSVTALGVQLARVLGLNHENALLDGGAGVVTGPTYSAKKVMLSGRLRVFADAAALAAATAGAANGADGEIYRYTVTGEDTGAGLAKSFKIARGL